MSADKTKSLLQSHLRLDRDKGISQLKLLLAKKDNLVEIESLLNGFHEDLSSATKDSEWEIIHGCVLGVKYIFDAFLGEENKITSESVVEFYKKYSLNALQHQEVRVRNEAGELLGVLCKLRGNKIYEQCQENLLELLRGDLQRHIESDSGTDDTSSSAKLSKDKIFHESAGWRFLETTMKCLRCMIEGCGKSFNPFITQELLDILFSSLVHTNRFVRETGFNVCAAIVVCGSNTDLECGNSIEKYGDQLAQHFAKGLADNWSQVRLASSVATRSFLTSFPAEDDCKKYFPALVPRLCLNRYYIAEGVRIYSQETWRLVCKENGKEIVEKYISDVVKYYVEATQADNHAVREAACACISELATKIDPNVVRTFVPTLLDALLECFQDDSWPVRDAACVACGNFILAFASLAQNKQQLLYNLFLANLRDPIPSVREGAGAALAKYVKAFEGVVLPIVLKEIEDGLAEVEKQPENADKFVGLDKRPVQFGVAKNIRDESDKRHTDQQMYSCGSLAPKMGRGSRGGCSDAKFRRPSEPWERSDGSIYLMSELSQYYPQEISKLFPSVIAALSHRQYSQHLIFLETVCKQLPKIAKGIGKRLFKMHLETFISFIFEAVTCDVQLTAAAGEDCLVQLGKFLGPSILRGRIEMYNDKYVALYDRILTQPVSPPFGQLHFRTPIVE